MQVFFGKVFQEADGSEMQTVREEFLQTEQGMMVKRTKTGIPFTLKDAAKAALLGAYEDEKNLGPDEKVKRYELFLKVKDAVDPADFPAEEIALLKKLIGKAYGVLIVGQAARFLEGKS